MGVLEVPKGANIGSYQEGSPGGVIKYKYTINPHVRDSGPIPGLVQNGSKMGVRKWSKNGSFYLFRIFANR